MAKNKLPTPDRRKENSVLVRKIDFWSSEKDVSGLLRKKISGVMRKYISGLVRKRCLVL